MTTLTMGYMGGHFVVTAPRSKGLVCRTSSRFINPGSRRLLVQARDQGRRAETGVSSGTKRPRLKLSAGSGWTELRGIMARSNIERYWNKVETAPEGVIAQVRVTDGAGPEYLLPYPCTLTRDGWVKAASGKPLAVRPTYWKLFVDTEFETIGHDF